MKWKRLHPLDIEEYPLVRSLSNKGKGWATMINAKAETFAVGANQPESHIHFYTNSLKTARKYYEEFKHLISFDIKTYSIEEKQFFCDKCYRQLKEPNTCCN